MLGQRVEMKDMMLLTVSSRIVQDCIRGQGRRIRPEIDGRTILCGLVVLGPVAITGTC